MREPTLKMVTRLQLAVVLTLSFLLILVFAAPLTGLPPQQPTEATQQAKEPSPLTVPSRPPAPLYTGEQGAQSSEITFVPLSRTVTAKFHVEDPNGYFLPTLRRENVAVYEDGVRQTNVTVEVEHAPVSVALLMEFGGRYHELNKALGLEVPTIGRELLGVIGRDDRVAVFTYDAKLDTLVDFNQGHEVLDRVFNQLVAPNVSEADFYDALLATLNRMLEVS